MKAVQQLTCLTLGRPNGPAYSTRALLNTSMAAVCSYYAVNAGMYVCRTYSTVLTNLRIAKVNFESGAVTCDILVLIESHLKAAFK